MNIQEQIEWLRNSGWDAEDWPHTELGDAADTMERLLADSLIKDRALRVACTALNEYAAMVADDTGDTMIMEHMGRVRDQCLNAQHGKLSSDPFPESKS